MEFAALPKPPVVTYQCRHILAQLLVCLDEADGDSDPWLLIASRYCGVKNIPVSWLVKVEQRAPAVADIPETLAIRS